MSDVTQELTPIDGDRIRGDERFVHRLARTLAADDADDIAQQTWLHALRRGGGGVSSPRGWLARIARNVACNFRRGEDRRRLREGTTTPRECGPSSVEVVEQRELHRSLSRSVDALDEQLRTVVRMRYFDGLPPGRIARELGLPVATVWNRLRRAIHLMRADLQDHDRDQRACVLPLGAASSTVTLAGAAFMTMKTKVISLGAVLAAILIAFFAITASWSEAEEDSLASAGERAQDSGHAEPSVSRSASASTSLPAVHETERPAAGVTTRATTGALVVKVVYGEADAPLVGIGIRIATKQAMLRYGSQLARTDSAGQAKFTELSPGAYRVWTDRGRVNSMLTACAVIPGETTEVVVRLDEGIDIEGVVVGDDGRGVAGAEVYLGVMVFISPDAAPAAVTDAQGNFHLRGCETMSLIGARAFGHSPAPMRTVQARAGVTVSVRLELGPAGGAIAGEVVDRHGDPVPGAVCQIGGPAGAAGVTGHPVPAQARSDGDGAFLIVGVPVGEQDIAVRAPGFGVWTGNCSVRDDATTKLAITLDAGVACAGTISFSDGSPAAGASVQAGESRTLTWFETRTDENGGYRLEGLAAGRIAITAALKPQGRAAAILRGIPGQTLSWDAKLSAGVRLEGRVVNEAGEALDTIHVIAAGSRDGKAWFGSVRTAGGGRFAISNCPPSPLVVTVGGAYRATVRDVDPLAGELIVRVSRVEPPSVRITGKVFGPDDKPCTDAVAWVLGRGVPNSGYRPCDPETGIFEIGPLEPGEYRLKVQSGRYPMISSELRVLAPEATWDHGVLRLVEGGRVGVELTGATSPRLSMVIRDGEDRFAGRIKPGGAQLSGPLAPGRHQLVVSGPGVEPRSVPFDVRAGVTMRLTVELSPRQ